VDHDHGTRNDENWLKINIGQYGYYRVQYPLDEWQKFSRVLQNSPSQFSSSDRTSLINDAFALAKVGMLPYGTALDLTIYLGSKERSVAPWETAFLALDYMAGVLYFNEVYPKLNDYVAKLVKEPFQDLGWTGSANDSMDTLKLRSVILKKMCVYGNASGYAGQLLLDFMQNGTEIKPDLREIVYSYGMRAEGNQEVWNWMLNKYKVESNAQEKLKLLRGLTSIGEPWILSHLLELAKDETIIRSQDYFTLLTYMSWNKIGEPLVWDFVRAEWPYLVSRFTLNDRLMGRMISDITERFASNLRLEEMTQFFQKYPEAGAGETYRKIALETVRNNIAFLENNVDTIDKWLSK